MKSIFAMRYCLALALCVFSSVCSAGIQLGGTRVVYPAADREASILVRNQGSADIMIQSWMEPDTRDKEADVPFAITPSLARMGGNKQQMLRIFYHGKGLAEDRESVFWLNIQEIPQQAKEDNTLQVAFRQRIKVFYRPAGITGTPTEASAQLQWRLVTRDGASQLEVQNSSALNISLGTLKLNSGQRDYAVEEQMLAPKSTTYMKIKKLNGLPLGTAKLYWEAINDYGGLIKHETSVSK
ncbi:molecular chaperone [Pseudomonas sp. ADAK18]|uniref:fimbrial biogenesis chaperone n=1 Tax=Pseudomonas sp. ADAK18 TaxID=2730848 RepID=UPI0014644615|nr:molecular chaperone [Pseudomonas sp. ADAK18]QJI31248.1 molecular chaperone [Pseudomonas sp. ADAK18]